MCARLLASDISPPELVSSWYIVSGCRTTGGFDEGGGARDDLVLVTINDMSLPSRYEQPYSEPSLSSWDGRSGAIPSVCLKSLKRSLSSAGSTIPTLGLFPPKKTGLSSPSDGAVRGDGWGDGTAVLPDSAYPRLCPCPETEEAACSCHPAKNGI